MPAGYERGDRGFHVVHGSRVADLLQVGFRRALPEPLEGGEYAGGQRGLVGVDRADLDPVTVDADAVAIASN